MQVLVNRIFRRNQLQAIAGPVVYRMSRDQRIHDNWALIYAQKRAIEMKQPLVLIFALCDEFLGASSRHYDFMLSGLSQVEKELKSLNIGFSIIQGAPPESIGALMQEIKAGLLVTDFSPLKISQNWNKLISDKICVEFLEVDTHNIVPCWVASSKLEFAARTFRPRILAKLTEYLTEFPQLVRHPFSPPNLHSTHSVTCNASVYRPSGESNAKSRLKDFLQNRLQNYHLRNDPNADACSGLSPYFHFGQISAQRVALEVMKTESPNKESFLEELIVRRELADNFCYYNPNYDQFEGFHRWAKETLDKHRNDTRQYLYTKDKLENARTHDPLWNAAQMEAVKTGIMPGYLRMYWAKKILEWTHTPEEALAIAIALNDRYLFDGRDPNGYTGIAWSIGGIHDRAWNERPILGKIRYMSLSGCERKFNVSRYIEKVNAL